MYIHASPNKHYVHTCILKNIFVLQVQIGFRNSKRNTTLQGHGKLACRAIVMKQYKTALNHLLQLEDVKKELGNNKKNNYFLSKITQFTVVLH